MTAPVASSRLDGILVVDKPAGPTSHDIVGLIRRLSGMKRVGHGGTLDPFARGVLPIFLGRATRVVEYHLADRKQYRATVCFGASSTTDDLEGELTPMPLATSGSGLDRGAVETALAAFRGPIVQVPPAYSAIKVAGRRAYALARAGQKPELAPRSVTIDLIELLEWDGTDPERPIAVVEVDCSAGTYIRAIARDLGTALGTGAYLGALTRTASGPFSLAQAVSLDAVRAAAGEGAGQGTAQGALGAMLLPMDAGLELRSLSLTAEELSAVVRGQFIRPAVGVAGPADESPVRLLSPAGELVGFGRWDGTRVMPDKVLVDA